MSCPPADDVTQVALSLLNIIEGRFQPATIFSLAHLFQRTAQVTLETLWLRYRPYLTPCTSSTLQRITTMSNYPNNYPFNNYPSQVESTAWHLSSQGSITVVVCLPIAALLLFALGCRLGYVYRRNKYPTPPPGTTACIWNANLGQYVRWRE
jgi:hypothetical protein